MFYYSSVARNLSQLIRHLWSMFFLFSMALLPTCKWHTLVLVRDRYVLVCNMLFLLQQWHTLHIMLLNRIHVYLVHYAATVDTEPSQRPLVFPLSCCDQVSTKLKPLVSSFTKVDSLLNAQIIPFLLNAASA
jgi:hypothetical protein